MLKLHCSIPHAGDLEAPKEGGSGTSRGVKILLGQGALLRYEDVRRRVLRLMSP